MPDQLNIVAISGSLRSKSFNTSLLRAMQGHRQVKPCP